MDDIDIPVKLRHPSPRDKSSIYSRYLKPNISIFKIRSRSADHATDKCSKNDRVNDKKQCSGQTWMWCQFLACDWSFESNSGLSLVETDSFFGLGMSTYNNYSYADKVRELLKRGKWHKLKFQTWTSFKEFNLMNE